MTNPTTWEERWITALRDQHNLLFDPKTRSLKPEFAEYVNCPVCDSADFHFHFEKDGFQFMRCDRCSMVFMNPRMNIPATHAFYNSGVNEIYNEQKFDQVSASTILDDLSNFENLKLIQQFMGPRKCRILEIGSAKGVFLQKAKELGYEIYGLELNQRNYAYSRKLLGDTIMNVDLSAAQFEDGMFDVVYMRDVIEHIATPQPFIEEVNRITKTGGIVFLETANIEGWVLQIAREKHNVIFGFEHPVLWSPKTLGMLLSKNHILVKKVKHSSSDFTVEVLLNFLITPSFTKIDRQPVGKGRRLFITLLLIPYKGGYWLEKKALPFFVNHFGAAGRLILRIFVFPFKILPWIDRNTLPHLANLFQRGSVLRVIAQKE